LKILDIVAPGKVNWAKVNLKPSNKYQKIENCNYAIDVSKMINLSLVGIGGKDFVDGNRKLLLALIWQLMHFHIFSILRKLKFDGRVKDGKVMDEKRMIKWANGKVTKAGKQSRMQNFKDQSLSHGTFLIDLIDSIKPGAVNYQLVNRGQNDDECMLNAKYAISVARKIGSCIFLLWEDIVEVKPKMILTFVGTLMSLCKD